MAVSFKKDKLSTGSKIHVKSLDLPDMMVPPEPNKNNRFMIARDNRKGSQNDVLSQDRISSAIREVDLGAKPLSCMGVIERQTNNGE